MIDKIITWTKKVKANYYNDTTVEEKLSEIKLLYEVLVWFVVSYGEENYFLILNNLKDSEKEIFEKYLSISKSSKEKNISKIFENKSDNVEEKDEEEVIRKLFEKGENYYFGRGVKKDNKKAYNFLFIFFFYIITFILKNFRYTFFFTTFTN